MLQNLKPVETGEDGDPAACFARRVEGTNINADTLLATDYLNHFNEVVMLIDLLPDMPDARRDIDEWKPLSYIEHFAESGFRDKELAIAAYPHAPESARRGLEETVDEINKVVLAGVQELNANLDIEDDVGLSRLCAELSRYLRHLLDQASGHINGTHRMVHETASDGMDTPAENSQHAIDALMG